jgi:peptide/nickel transport system permease protein
MFVVICILCFGAPLFTKYSPTQIDLRARMAEPGGVHFLGADQMGRDIWARMLYGGQISIIVGLGSALGAALIGVSLGMFVGYKGGWLDSIILKISDVFLSFPQMVLIIIIVALVGQKLENMILIFILTGWPSMYRMARSKVLSLKEEEFVQALRAFGISDLKIAFKHMLPNCVGPIVVNITLSTAMFILQEASLSVLGYGVPQEIATWGNIINVITNAGVIRYDWLGYWWMWLPCAVMLILFVLAINFIGDGLRDASDPTQIG